MGKDRQTNGGDVFDPSAGEAPLSESQIEAEAKVLIVDDEVFACAALGRVLTREGYEVETSTSADSALQRISARQFDLVITDICMPGMDGLGLLEKIRDADPDLPVILLTGHPGTETAVRAVELGALHYFQKPLDMSRLVEKVAFGIKYRRMARLAGLALEMGDTGYSELDQEAVVAENFTLAMRQIWVAYQPIVHARFLRSSLGYEAFLRCNDPILRTPLKLLFAAKRLHRTDELSALVHTEVARFLAAYPEHGDVFLNVHIEDLLGASLADERAPLSAFSERIVLEVSQREAVDEAKGIRDRVDAIRGLGYRLAIDDLGTETGALSSLITLRPDFVKLDDSLVRNIDLSPEKQDLLETMIGISHELGVKVIAEGVETEKECMCLRGLDCDLIQGYWIGRPTEAFPKLPELGPHLTID